MMVFYMLLIAGCALLGNHERCKVYDRISQRIERRMNGLVKKE